MSFLGKLLGKEETKEKQEPSPDFFDDRNKGLNDGFSQSDWQIPKRPTFGEEGMGDDFQNYNHWQPNGASQQPPNQMPHETGQFNENVQIREINDHPHMNTQQTQNWSDKSISKDLEIISSKLDAIKSSIESLDYRVRNLERIAEGGQRPTRYPYNQGKNF